MMLTLLITVTRTLLWGAWFILRPILGWFFILFGIIGMPLPLINGTIFLLIGLVLVGQRNKVVRWTRVHIKLMLVRWAALPTPLIGTLGRLALRTSQQMSRQHRRMRWWWRERYQI